MDAALAALVRRHDPDRFLGVLFAPPEKRDALLALYAFNHELARAREVASQPMLALIRLQWWREVVEGAARHHVVATPLRAAIDAGVLPREDLLALIAAREIEADPQIDTLAEWRGYMLGCAGGVAVAAARALAATRPDALRPLGAAYGVAGLLRSTNLMAAQGRCLLPADLLGEQGASPEAAIAAPEAPPVRRVQALLAEQGRSWLRQAAPGACRGAAAVAALPAVLARRDLARWPRPTPMRRGIADRIAVVIAGVRRRV
ncbi:MAG TPA: squalene/phytoene synthase family protein [Acetobacteraceae bacterium]|nr:squalene/phytoene synthase family protein [Acetobacteraceae bacterium]